MRTPGKLDEGTRGCYHVKEPPSDVDESRPAPPGGPAAGKEPASTRPGPRVHRDGAGEMELRPPTSGSLLLPSSRTIPDRAKPRLRRPRGGIAPNPPWGCRACHRRGDWKGNIRVVF